MSQKRLIFAYRMKLEFFSQMNYYNEWDKGAAAWLRELIKRGHIPYGYVDERSITDVRPSDLEGFTQCHFFAGIGGWSRALQLAGVPATVPLWTGSPPCQPFSVAGKQLGQLDERHLAPTFMRLVEECQPAILLGEQVAAAIGKHWLDDLFTELERQGYACGSAVLPACSVGAPHKRDRLFFGAVNQLADASGTRHMWSKSAQTEEGQQSKPEHIRELSPRFSRRPVPDIQQGSRVGGVANTNDNRQPTGQRGGESCGDKPRDDVRGSRTTHSVADANSPGLERREGVQERTSEQPAGSGGMDSESADAHFSHWSCADWLGCRDGKLRPVESGTFPLVDGLSKILDDLRTIETRLILEIESYASTCKTDTGQMLSALRNHLQQKASRAAEQSGMLFELHASKVLLAFLLCIISARESGTESGGKQKENDAKCWEFLRVLRIQGEFSGASYRWQSYESTAGKPSDPLFTLSLILARNVETYWEKAVNAHAAAGRVAMLRGAGNAIVPQVAAEFITAFMESI